MAFYPHYITGGGSMEVEATNYQDFDEIKEVNGESTVNKYLEEGWKLLFIYSQNRGEGLQGDNFVRYVLGRKKPEKKDYSL